MHEGQQTFKEVDLIYQMIYFFKNSSPATFSDAFK